MPIERHTENSGIFTRESTKATGPDIEAILCQWASAHNDLWEHWLTWSEAAAEAVLGRAEASPAARRDAHLAMGLCRALRHYLDRGDTHAAAFQAFQLGQAVTRLGTRWAEPSARLGGQVREGRRQGHIVAHGTIEEKRRRWGRYQSQVNAVYWQNPKRRHWPICQIVAEQLAGAGHRVSPRTIYRHTCLPKSR